MKEFLANIRPPKFLRYFFCIIYSWYRGFKSERDAAHGTAIIFLAGFHCFILLGIFLNFGNEITMRYSKFKVVIPFLLIFATLFYYLFWYKNKWKNYVQEFYYLKRKDRLRGSIYLFMGVFLAYYPILLDMFFGIDLRDQ